MQPGFGLEIPETRATRRRSGYIPIVIEDACGGREEAAMQQELAGLSIHW
jgi:hypothetical protein